jgi:hypothetical protein
MATNLQLMKQVNELKRQNHQLRFENLKMRLDFEALLDLPLGEAANKILKRYRAKRSIRREAVLASKN